LPLKRKTVNPKAIQGAKKVDLSVISPVAIAHEACALMDGEWKYGPRNWRDKPITARAYIGAVLRHIHAWAEGEEVAEDSKVHHLGHARACLGILLDAMENGSLIDNRDKGVFPKTMVKLNDWVKSRKKTKVGHPWNV